MRSAAVSPVKSRPVPSIEITKNSLPWRERQFLTMQLAGEIAGVSVASLYRFADDKKLTLRRLGGRTLVETSSLIGLIDGAEAWTPSQQTSKACAARVAVSQNNWR